MVCTSTVIDQFQTLKMKFSNVSFGLRVLIRAWTSVFAIFIFFLLLFSFCKLFSSPLFANSFSENGNRLLVHRLGDLDANDNYSWESGNIELCPLSSLKLIGWTNISAFINEKPKTNFADQMKNAGVKVGGRYETTECWARHKIAIVVPFRNRAKHLTIFLRYMHPFLQRQQLNYTIIVVEQSNNGSPFNRGTLMNIGFVEAQLQDQFQCFIFHDVDLLPENDSNPYTCPEDGKPRQMSFSIDSRNNYKPTLRKHFGGVTALSVKDFQSLNGYSNVFWGWGGEDDQLFDRVKFSNMTVTRAFDDQPSLIHLTRYKSLSHQKAKPNPDRLRLIEEGLIRYKNDGLTNLKYRRLGLQRKLLYTHVLVDIHPSHSDHKASSLSTYP